VSAVSLALPESRKVSLYCHKTVMQPARVDAFITRAQIKAKRALQENSLTPQPKNQKEYYADMAPDKPADPGHRVERSHPGPTPRQPRPGRRRPASGRFVRSTWIGGGHPRGLFLRHVAGAELHHPQR